MSLRIRRGTDSQRQGITPLEGELLYATDTKKLYVGDGSTGGGIIVDSSAGTSTINDLANVTAPSPNTNDILKWSGSAWITAAQNAASALNDLTNVTAPSPNVNDGILWNGTAWVTGPSVATLNDITNVSVPTAPGVGQSLVWSGSAWIAGTPYGVGNDINANIIGGDSTVMVNVINQTIIATTLTGNFVGDVFAEDGVSKIVSNGAVAGQAIFTGDLEGNVNGSVFTTNSTRIVDGDTGNITGEEITANAGFVGNVTGDLTGAIIATGTLDGDVTGSIFSDDSSIMVDAVGKQLFGDLIGTVAGDVNGDLTGQVVGNVTGNVVGNLTGNSTGLHTGDVNGSIFADDSTLLLDGVAGKITGPIDTAINSFFEANLQLFKNVASDATRQQISVYSNQHGAFSQTAMNITNTGDTAVANELGFFKVRGTAQAFTATQASDSLGGVSWSAYDGSAVQVGNSIKSEAVSISANNLAAKMCFYVRNGLIATYVKKAELSETGVFKVDTINSFTTDADLTLSANGTGNVKMVGGLVGGVQAISGAGAIDVATLHTEITTTGADAYTLANGAAGQLKIISMKVDGGDGTLTPTTLATGTTITFNDVNDSVTMIYSSLGWLPIALQGAVVA